jgi:hypothetical protein
MARLARRVFLMTAERQKRKSRFVKCSLAIDGTALCARGAADKPFR